MRIPDCKYEKEKRIELLWQEFDKWINKKALITLVELFGGKIPEGDLGEKLNYLNEFVNIWDYRKKLANTKSVNERWNISDDEFVLRHAEEIVACSCELGLVKTGNPQFEPDYILPLGGARYTNFDRPMRAKEAIEAFAKKEGKIVALTGTRPINEKEREAVDSYAPGALTEYEAMNAGLEKVFELPQCWSGESHENENINLCWYLSKNEQKYKGYEVYSVAAPSTSPERRANSRDTFEFFLKSFKVEKGSRLLLVTNQIYVPYQLLKIADLAIEQGFDVDCIGVEMDTRLVYSKASNYLQEIKGTVNVMSELYGKYCTK